MRYREIVCTYHQAQLKNAKRHGAIRQDLWDKLVGEFESFSETGIEPKHVVPVLTGEREVVRMKWGFQRRFKKKRGEGLTAPKPVVNAKAERMGDFMWRDAYRHRRCIVPVTAFYEWTGPTGAKVAHRFHMGGDCFFVAGLWEDHPEFGLCHTMLTTEPNREVAATGHDRCLVALLDHEIEPWLDGRALADFHRPDGMFQVETDVPNPRAREPKERKPPSPPEPPSQGELF